jgi:hypothetical protein
MSERMDCIGYLRQYLPNAEYLIDVPGNAMNGFLEALWSAGNDAVVHMEEDVWLTENFKEKAENVIQTHSDEVIQFFSMRQADIDKGSRYEHGRTFMMNQCFYFPKGYSKEVLEYYPNWPQKEVHPTGYDILIADFLKERKEKYFLSVPSLVDHRKGKSLINPKRSNARQAKVFKDGLYE